MLDDINIIKDEKELSKDELIDQLLSDSNLAIKKNTNTDDIDDVDEENIESICMNVSNVVDLTFDAQAFQSGIDSISKLCGQIVALSNVGVTPLDALEYLANKETTDFLAANNKDIAQIKANSELNIAKHDFIQAQQTIV